MRRTGALRGSRRQTLKPSTSCEGGTSPPAPEVVGHPQTVPSTDTLIQKSFMQMTVSSNTTLSSKDGFTKFRGPERWPKRGGGPKPRMWGHDRLWPTPLLANAFFGQSILGQSFWVHCGVCVCFVCVVCWARPICQQLFPTLATTSLATAHFGHDRLLPRTSKTFRQEQQGTLRVRN